MHRQREWDEVITVPGPTEPGAEAHLVVLGPGRVVVEEGSSAADSAALVAELRTPPPYRAWVVHSGDGRWGVAARRLHVVQLSTDPGADEIEIVWDGVERVVRLDGVRTVVVVVEELEAIGRRRFPAFVVTAHRIVGDLWEVDVAPL
jgi:hypothetical protein